MITSDPYRQRIGFLRIAYARRGAWYRCVLAAGIWGQRGSKPSPPGLGWWLLFVQPGGRANLDAAAEGAIVPGYVGRRTVAQIHLAGKVGAEAAVLQSSAGDATAKDRAVASACFAQLVATAAAVAVLEGVARAAIGTTDSG